MGTVPYLFFLTFELIPPPHFVPRVASNNLQMLNTQNLPTLLYNVHKMSVEYILTQYNIAQYAARSSVVVFHTASGFLRQKTDVAKTKGAAVSSLQINTLWQDQWYALLHLNPGGHHQEDQSGCDGHPHGQNKTTFYSVSDPNQGLKKKDLKS